MAFLNADPRMSTYLCFRLRSSLTPDELGRAIAPEDWTAQGQIILEAVWIKHRLWSLSGWIGPFADETVAMQFANADRLLGHISPLLKERAFELRHGIKPGDLLDTTPPEQWSWNPGR